MVPGASLPRLAECRECHEPIRFVRMAATGRNMPVNPKPREKHEDHPGVVAAHLVGPGLVGGHVVTAEHPAGDKAYLFTPHWSTCSTRRTTKKAAPTHPRPTRRSSRKAPHMATHSTEIEFGNRYSDKLTGFTGVATSVVFYPFGPERVSLAHESEDRLRVEWFDAPSLVARSTTTS